MTFIEYELHDQHSVRHAVVSVLESSVTIALPCPSHNGPLPSFAAKVFFDSLHFPTDGEYSARVETWSLARQPWPVFIFEEFGFGDCVGEFYPKDFDSQTITE